MKKRTVIQMMNQASSDYNNNPYLSDKNDQGWNSVTFSKTQEKSLQLASGLLELGIDFGDKIAIISEAKTDWVISEFATLYTRAISVPLSIKLLPEEVPFRVNHSDAKLLIVSENTLEKVISHWDLYEYKALKLIVLDKPSNKITELCNKFDFNENDLIFVDDLYQLGFKAYKENQSKIKELEEQIEEDDIVTISYTSGTTGNPKGIMLTHLNYYVNSQGGVDAFKIKELISTLIILPTDHSFAHTVGIYIGLVKGLSLSFVDARGGGMNALKNIPSNLLETQPNFLMTVPALTGNFINKFKEGIQSKGKIIQGIFNRGVAAGIKRNGNGHSKPGLGVQINTYLNYKIADLLIFKKLKSVFGSKIEFLIGGGALLDVKQQQFYQAIGIPVYQGYGLTEAAPVISVNTKYFHKMGTSGKVLGNVTCKICDENGKELAQGAKGEIVIKGDNVMKGYYKNEKATNDVLKEGWLFTGDLGYFDQDDFLVVVGREKALLISEDGEKYSPEEIEEAMVGSSSFIHQVMIYNDHKKYTTALLTLNLNHVNLWVKEQKPTSYKNLLEQVKKEMHLFEKHPEFKGKFPKKWIPSQFQIIEEEFSEENKMINSTLKMVRHRITETYKERLETMYVKNAHQLEKEKNIEVLTNMFSFDNEK